MQEKNGFFFCLEDRAVLCRDCDVSIHSVNKLAANHQRFLLPGTKVALEAICGDSGGGAPSPQEAAQPEAVMGRAGAAMSGTGTGTGGGKLPHQQQQQYQVTAARTGSPPVQATSTSPPTGGGGVVTAGRMALEIGRGPPSAARITATAAGGMVVSGPPPARVPAAAGAGGMVVPGPACSYVTNTSSSSHSSAGGSVGMGLGGLGGGAGVAGLRRSSISEYLTEGVPGWRVEELLNIPELAEGYTLADVCSSKVSQAVSPLSLTACLFAHAWMEYLSSWMVHWLSIPVHLLSYWLIHSCLLLDFLCFPSPLFCWPHFPCM